MLAAFVAAQSSLVLQPAAHHVPRTQRAAAVMQFGEATRDPSGGFDEEGGMVKGIEEGGMTLEQVRANYGKEGPKLPAEKAAKLVLPEASFKISKMDVSQTDEDFVMECSSMNDTEMFVDVEPAMNTYEDYFFGLTSDSHPTITISQDESSPIEGRMDRRGGAATSVKLKFEPNGASGEFEAYLCFVLENEPDFSKFYKITGKTQ